MRLILFDIDCTLLYTQGAGREATRLSLLEVFGTSGTIERFKFGGKTDWQAVSEVLSETGISAAEIERLLPAYSAAMSRHLAALIQQYEVRACPGAVELVKQLRQRDDVALGLVTGNLAVTAPIKLRAAGFDPAWFPVGAYGSESTNRDHLPALAVKRAVEHYRYPFAPPEVIVIGDTPADVSCARALGAVAVAVETGFCQPGELAAARADYLLRDLTEFSSVME